MKDSDKALFWARMGFMAISFIPVLAYHFIVNLLGFQQRVLLILSYIFLVVPSLILGWTDLIYARIGVYFWGYYPVAGKLYFLSLVTFGILFTSGLVLLLKGVFKQRALGNYLLAQQYLYVFIAFLFGTFGLIDYIIKYQIEIYPFGYIAALFFISLIAYAIVKFHLMDIRIIISRLAIFIFVYTLVLGIPFGLGVHYLGIGSWLWPVSMMAILATVGPFLFLHIKKVTEDRILREELRVQELLTKASYGINSIRNLDQLLSLVTKVLQKILHLDDVKIFLLSEDQYCYDCRCSLNSTGGELQLDGDSSLVRELKSSRHALSQDEIKLRSQRAVSTKQHAELVAEVRKLNANVVIPLIAGELLSGFITLGERKEKTIYSPELINVLMLLGNQAALAIENCFYFEAETKRREEQGFQERVASLDMMASSFAHEIDNPIGVVIGHVDLLDEVIGEYKDAVPEDLQQMMRESFEFIKEASYRVSGMIRVILEYSRMGTGELNPLSFNTVIDSFIILITPQYKKEKIAFVSEVDKNLPYILGEKIQLEEILMNFAINALHSTRGNSTRRVSLKAFKKDASTIRVEFKDNGYGIEPKMLNDIFLASVTTKGSSEGTGLGLYRVRKIATLHKGKVWAESEGKDKGATMIAEFPVYTGDIKDAIQSHDALAPKKSNKLF